MLTLEQIERIIADGKKRMERGRRNERQRQKRGSIESQRERFMDQTRPEGECIVWTGRRNQSGYGATRHNGRNEGAHRVSYRLFRGDIPEGLIICHHCDNPPCVNPAHLYAGTPKDNAHDKISRKRMGARSGYRAPSTLSPQTRAAIRRRYTGRHGEITQIARRFSVSPTTVSQIVRGEL